MFVALDPCDLRKSFDGLHALVTERLQETPQTGALFVFTNRRRHQTTFNIPIRHRCHRLPMAASPAWAKATRGTPQGTTRR
ncbi:MAG: IS66 family insertion sequence element accessory protein TnpB [Verrucomicrobia bacterium]|nr:IS66 family insertion sequence element accessory protein TnpB [Verrucomicrobiota bacterium]